METSNDFDSFEDEDRQCSSCKATQFYSIKYDAYFCKKCNKWLEINCKDPNCKFCLERPKKPVANIESKKKVLAELIKDLEIKDKRHHAAKTLRELAENGFDISEVVSVLLKLLDEEDVEDILYEYLYSAPDEISNYEENLHLFEAYFALEHFAKRNGKNAEFLLMEIEKAKIDKNLFWVKNLIKSEQK